MLPASSRLPRLDPTLDVVFKLLLVRTQALLVDMLEAVLGRPVARFTVLDPNVLGARASDKQVVFDVRVAFADGSRALVEMQSRGAAALRSRLVFYATRDHSDQLRRGEDYAQLTPTVVIAWLVRPITGLPRRLHTTYTLREDHTHEQLSDQLEVHVLQPSALTAAASTVYPPNVRVERWARFFSARSDADYEQLAKEDPIMAIAVESLDELSQDPAVHRLARERADELRLHAFDLAASRRQGLDEGRKEGRARLVKQLARRFGPLTEATLLSVRSASAEQLDSWAERLLDTRTLDDVLAG